MEKACAEQLKQKVAQLHKGNEGSEAKREELAEKWLHQVYECVEMRELVVVFNTSGEESDDELDRGIPCDELKRASDESL